MSPALDAKKVAIITGASGGIGAGLAAAFRATGYRVVGTSRSMPSSDDPDFLAAAEPGAMKRDGRVRRPRAADLAAQRFARQHRE